MSLNEIRSDWTRLGDADPLWAVLVAPGKQDGGWDVDAFLQTGRQEVDGALETLAGFGGKTTGARALDFGCGVGRLSQALAVHYDEVIGVDIAKPMLAEAQRLDRTGGRCRFVLNEEPHLRFVEDNSVDLVFTSLVLQHLPPALATGYLREFARITRPGGAVVVLHPTGIRMTLKGLLFRFMPNALLRAAQRYILRYPAPMRMHTATRAHFASVLTAGDMDVVGMTDEAHYAPHWTFTRFFAVKRQPRS